MSQPDDLNNLFHREALTARWRAEWENAAARMHLAQRDERAARLLSRHEPLASLGLDRERLRLALRYMEHGDLDRLDREHRDLRIQEAAQ